MCGSDLGSMLPDILPRLWVFALRISGDRHDAEELLQRACVRAFESAHQLKPDSSALSWMFSIVQSTWINELQAHSLRSRSSMGRDDDFLETVADPASGTCEENAINRQIIGAVERLPEAQRLVMLLVAVEGLSYGEAAGVLDVPIGTIMCRLSRARQAIGALFGASESRRT